MLPGENRSENTSFSSLQNGGLSVEYGVEDWENGLGNTTHTETDKVLQSGSLNFRGKKVIKQ